MHQRRREGGGEGEDVAEVEEDRHGAAGRSNRQTDSTGCP